MNPITKLRINDEPRAMPRGIQIAMLSALLVAGSVNVPAGEPPKDAARTTAPTHIASEGRADQETWREYINTTYHFRFQYPVSANLHDYGSQVGVNFRPKFDNGQEVWLGFSIVVFPNSRGLTAKELALEAVRGKVMSTDGDVSVLEQGAVQIGGREAYQIKIAESGKHYEGTGYEIFSVKGGNAYHFSYTDPQSLSYAFPEAVRERNTEVLSNLLKKTLGSFSFDKD